MKKFLLTICLMGIFAFLFSPTTVLAADPVYVLEGTLGENNYYISNVTLKCGDGWTVSRTADGAFSEEIVFVDEGSYGIKCYFKESITGDVVEETVSYKMDKTPVGFQMLSESGVVTIAYSGEIIICAV